MNFKRGYLRISGVIAILCSIIIYFTSVDKLDKAISDEVYKVKYIDYVNKFKVILVSDLGNNYAKKLKYAYDKLCIDKPQFIGFEGGFIVAFQKELFIKYNIDINREPEISYPAFEFALDEEGKYFESIKLIASNRAVIFGNRYAVPSEYNQYKMNIQNLTTEKNWLIIKCSIVAIVIYGIFFGVYILIKWIIEGFKR